MQCIKCNTNNRNIAKFCKKCGAEITQNAAQAQPAASRGVYIPPIEVLDDLVGLDELKDELSVLQATLEGMKNNQSTIRYQYNVMILGASGTGKTTIIPQLIADLFIKYNMITKSKPITADGGSLDSMPDKDINNLFSNAKGGIVFIDNAHKLVDTDGRALPAFLKFKNKMDENKDDPIIIMAGLPFGLREFIKSSESKDITGRFQKIFIIPDYTPAQLCAITEHTLFKQHGLGFSPESHEHLMNRFRYLFKELKKPDSGINAVNGYLAINEAHSITGSFYRRKPDSKIIIPDDITGKVEIIKDIQKIMEEMNDIIGMDTIKNEIGSLFTQLKQNAALEKMGKKTEKPAHHFVITGNPGTGKTTIARLLGNIFDGMGLLESGHVVEVDRSKLVAGFVGQTAPLTNANCDKAMGGILFIDEVYTLKQDDGDKFGQECIDTLLKRMEDDRGKFMVVVAGYKSPMEKFLTSNEGLKSRFTKYFNLEDYNPDELTRIFESLAKNQEYILQPEAKTKITAFFRDRCARKTKDFANGREARNLLEEAKKSQAVRLASSGASGLSEEISLTLMPEDIPGTTSDNMVTLEEALTELNKLTGLKSVKDTVAKIANTLKAQKVMGRNEVLSRHFVFTGNPGTGKTTVARILGDVFKALGLLPTSTLVETDRSKMIAAYSGQTAPLVNTQCDNAMGGILFVDEAYSLKQGQGDSYGQEAVDTLLKRMEDDRGKFIVIAAGYSKEMDEFLSSNTGFKSRFTDYINFDDYNPGEMFEIFMNLCKKENYETAPGFEQAILNKLKGMYASRTPSFANARDVRKLFEKVVENISTRIVRMVDSDLSVEEIRREGKILRSEDVDPGEKVLTTEEALKDLNELEGLKSVKDTVKKSPTLCRPKS